MTYRLAIVPAAERDLARLDPPVARRIRAELLSLAGENGIRGGTSSGWRERAARRSTRSASAITALSCRFSTTG